MKRDPVYGECIVCGSKFLTKKSHLGRRKTCSKECDSKRRKTMYAGENNPNFGNRGPNSPLFKTGEKITNYGYRKIYKPDHPNAKNGGYILEHRYVMSKHLGRPLRDDEHVHHKDENKLNNDISNLEIVSRSEHSRLHNANKLILRDELGKIAKVLKNGRTPMKVNVKVKRLHPDAKKPQYAHEGDVCFDLIAIDDVIIEPGETKKIPTGLALQQPPDFAIEIRPRSGISEKTKLRISNSPGTIDQYTGEIGVLMDNIAERTHRTGSLLKTVKGVPIEVTGLTRYLDENTYIIRKGERIAQALVAPVYRAHFQEVDELTPTDRGDGGFGSSGVSSN